jgi:hypothetical protein
MNCLSKVVAEPVFSNSTQEQLCHDEIFYAATSKCLTQVCTAMETLSTSYFFNWVVVQNTNLHLRCRNCKHLCDRVRLTDTEWRRGITNIKLDNLQSRHAVCGSQIHVEIRWEIPLGTRWYFHASLSCQCRFQSLTAKSLGFADSLKGFLIPQAVLTQLSQQTFLETKFNKKMH